MSPTHENLPGAPPNHLLVGWESSVSRPSICCRPRHHIVISRLAHRLMKSREKPPPKQTRLGRGTPSWLPGPPARHNKRCQSCRSSFASFLNDPDSSTLSEMIHQNCCEQAFFRRDRSTRRCSRRFPPPRYPLRHTSRFSFPTRLLTTLPSCHLRHTNTKHR